MVCVCVFRALDVPRNSTSPQVPSSSFSLKAKAQRIGLKEAGWESLSQPEKPDLIDIPAVSWHWRLISDFTSHLIQLFHKVRTERRQEPELLCGGRAGASGPGHS